jgi:hypothetical protein
MSTTKRHGSGNRPILPQGLPPMPPPTEAEQRESEEICRRLREAARILEQRNLDHAVRLAHQAAARQGPLVEHFMELGRRFGDSLDKPPPRPRLQVIDGGWPDGPPAA